MGFIDSFIAQNRAKFRVEKVLTEKPCTQCGEVLPLTSEYFYRGGSTAHMGFASACKKCTSKRVRARYRRLHPIPEKPEFFICKRCGIEKPFTPEYYARSRTHRWGLKYQCKACRYVPAPKKPKVPKGSRRCTCCERIKPKGHFYPHRGAKINGYRASWCKRCAREHARGVGRKGYQQEYFGGRTSFDWLWDYIQSSEFAPNNHKDVFTEEDKRFEIEDWIAWAS